jgi:antitoxin VapB
MAERHVKLFRNGRNQAVRIPREFELPGHDAIMRKEGQRLIIEPAPPRSLLAVLESLPTLEEDFSPVEDESPVEDSSVEDSLVEDSAVEDSPVTPAGA